MSKGICFVISQIGEEGSVERKQADAVLDVVQVCCELHELECIRADKIKGSADINDDIIEYIRSADVCIVDLTNLNPNVMYEFGIRFQTGYPYIVLAHKSTKLPFDTITRRTIFYDDLELASECRRVQKEIREYIGIFEGGDFRSLAFSPSLTNIYAFLEKLEKKIDEIGSYPAFKTVSNSNPIDFNSLEDLLSKLDPSEAFHYAYKTNQISLAEELLKLLKGNHPDEYYFNKLCALATKGSAYAATELEDMMDSIINTGDNEQIIEAVGSLVTNYNHRDIEKSKLDYMSTIFTRSMETAETNKEHAAILNQQQRLFAGAGEFNVAKSIAEQIIMMNDEEPAYFFNYATILSHLGEEKQAIEQIKKMLKVTQKADEDHLLLACKLLKNSEKTEDQILYQKCLSGLEEINPYKARFVRFQ